MWFVNGHGETGKPYRSHRDYVGGRLIRVLPEWRNAPAPGYALFPSDRQFPTQIRVFHDAMVERVDSRPRATNSASVSGEK